MSSVKFKTILRGLVIQAFFVIIMYYINDKKGLNPLKYNLEDSNRKNRIFL